MSVIETRLAGHQATMKNITRVINRHLGAMQLARVELSFSTQSAERLVPEAAKKSIATLLREHGMGTALVSVRPHEGPIDDASGEHVVRLFPAEQRGDQPAQRGGLFAWLARWFPRWFKEAPSVATGSAQAVAPAKPVKAPALSNATTVAHLRKAVELACAYVETDTGSAIVVGRNSAQVVGSAQVVVRLDYLHEAMGPMVRDYPAQAAKSIGDMVRAQGLSVASTFKVSYAYKPRQEVVGTSYANETDVDVVLRLNGGTAEPVEPTLDDSDMGTAMPVRTLTLDEEPEAAIQMRVLGTLVAGKLQPFAKPFALPDATLPARFDRAALAAAGFASAHPGLLAVASNSCPLLISRGEGGVVLMQAAARATAQGGSLPMYYRAESLVPLMSEEIVGNAPLQLVVNDPAGVVDAASGKMLSALVVELGGGA
jgi:hypothetical protein